MDKAAILAEFENQKDFMREHIFCDEVLIAIIQIMDYDLAKSLRPDTAEEPEMIPALMDEMRIAAVETWWKNMVRMIDD